MQVGTDILRKALCSAPSVDFGSELFNCHWQQQRP